MQKIWNIIISRHVYMSLLSYLHILCLCQIQSIVLHLTLISLEFNMNCLLQSWTIPVNWKISYIGYVCFFSEAINGTHFVLSMLVDDLFIRLFNVRIFRLWKIIACTLCTHVKWKESLSEFPFARKIYSGKHCVDAVKTESECICEWIKPGMLQHITFTNIKTRKISIFKMTM